MAVLDWGSNTTLVRRLAGAAHSSRREALIAAPVPCWSDPEVGVHPVAGFLTTKPCRVTQVRRVPALSRSLRTKAAGHAPKMPVGSA